MSQGQERVWFYYARESQVGPLQESELLAAIVAGQLTQDDYVYREGFSDWKFLKDVGELSQAQANALRKTTASTPMRPLKPHAAGEKPNRKRERVPIRERVVAHNDAHVASGHISNISLSGVFFETASGVFAQGDEVKLTLKEGRGLGKPMHLHGVIVRQCRGEGLPTGYGLELRGLDDAARGRIADYIKRHEAS